MPTVQDSIKQTAQLIREAHLLLPGPQFIREFSSLIDQLFPGGYANTFQKIQEGDSAALEFGLVFVEVKPYFFRSQYMRTKLIRKLKKAKLTPSQIERLKPILESEHETKVMHREKVPSYRQLRRTRRLDK